MMRGSFKIGITIGLLATLFISPTINGQLSQAPPEEVARYTLKLAGLEKRISSLGDVSIYVMNSKSMGDLFISKKSEKIGKSQLSTVMVSDDVPGFKVTILFIGAEANVEAAIAYARNNKVMTVTSLPELVERGITLGVGVDDTGKMQVLLNMTASKAEGLDWSPAIMKIAKVIQ